MGILPPREPSPRPDPARFGVLAFACSLSLITYLDRICIMRVSQDMRNDLLFSAVQMGLVFSAFAVGYALFEMPGGWMGDRWGARRVLLRIVLWWSVFTALTGTIFSVPEVPLIALGLMLAVRFFFGAGEAGAYPNLARVVRVWFPRRERAGAQGAIWMCARLGGALAPFVIGRLTYRLGGWRPAFWVLGLIGAVWAVFFYLYYRDQPAQSQTPAETDDAYPPPDFDTSEVDPAAAVDERMKRAESGTVRARDAGRLGNDIGDAPLEGLSLPARRDIQQPVASGHEWPSLRVLAASLSIWAVCLVSFCVSLGWYFYPTWQPEYLSEVYGIRYADSEILTGLPFLCGAVGSLLGGFLSDLLIRLTGNRRWGRSLIGVIGFGLAGVCVFATGLTTEWWQAVALLCLAFFLNDLAIPVIWAVCADVGGRFVGSVAGLMNMTGAVGALLCPILIPLLLDFVLKALPPTASAADRWFYVFAALSATWFVGAAAWLFVDASKPIFGEHRRP